MSQIRGEHVSSKCAEHYVRYMKPLDFYTTLCFVIFNTADYT